MRFPRSLPIWLPLWGLALAPGCRCDSQDAPTPSASAAAVDRLAPGEKAPGSQSVFGLPVPPALQIDRQFSDSAYLTGRASPDDVADFIRKHVQVRHVEIAAGKTVFPRVYIKGDKSKKVYRIEVFPAGRDMTRVKIANIMPTPATKGLSETQRWRQAGRSPDGKQLDRLNVY